jgi:hypothetical protein
MSTDKFYIRIIGIQMVESEEFGISNEIGKINALGSCKECLKMSDLMCKDCGFIFCGMHIWDNLCLSCLKETLKLDFLKGEKILSLSSELARLEQENIELSFAIHLATSKIAEFSTSMKSTPDKPLDSLKQKLEIESKNSKNLQKTSESLNLALEILKTSENAIIAHYSNSLSSLKTQISQIDYLKQLEIQLLSELDDLHSTLSQSVPFSFLSKFICPSCKSSLSSLRRSSSLSLSRRSSLAPSSHIKSSSLSSSCNCALS